MGRWSWQSRAIERAERRAGAPPVVAVRDLVLLKLYAGGNRDLWDVRELLDLPGATDLTAEVDEDIRPLPADLRERWAGVRSR